MCSLQSKLEINLIQVRAACKRNARYLPCSLDIFYDKPRCQAIERSQSPLIPLPASLKPPPPLYSYFNPPRCTCLAYLSVGGLAGTKTNSPPPHTGRLRHRVYLFIPFQETTKAARLFCSLCPWYERGRKGSRGAHGRRGSFSKRVSWPGLRTT